jgi:hypothetical protein
MDAVGRVFRLAGAGRSGVGVAAVFPADHEPMATRVEYDRRGIRTVRAFTDAYTARRFYSVQLKLNHNPKVIGASTMSPKVKSEVVAAAQAIEAPVATTVAAAVPQVETPKAKAAPKAKKAAVPVATPPVAATPAEQATKAIRWTEKKLCLLSTLSKANAISSQTGISKEQIVKLSKGQALTTLNPQYDLTVQGYLGNAVSEESGHTYFVTKKGLKVLADAAKAAAASKG